MAATAEQLKEARKKAVKSPRIGKRGKHKKTLLREEAYKEVIKSIVMDAIPLVKELKRIAFDADEQGNVRVKAITEALDRAFGKAAQPVEINGDSSFKSFLEACRLQDEADRKKNKS